MSLEFAKEMGQVYCSWETTDPLVIDFDDLVGICQQMYAIDMGWARKIKCFDEEEMFNSHNVTYYFD